MSLRVCVTKIQHIGCVFFLFQEYLHAQRCIHGNIGARSVLVGSDQTAKLWGLGSAYRRKMKANVPGAVENMELKKWQAPEVLSRRIISSSSDVWVHQHKEKLDLFRIK